MNIAQTKQKAIEACGPDAVPTAYIRFHLNSGRYEQMWKSATGGMAEIWLPIPDFGFGDDKAMADV